MDIVELSDYSTTKEDIIHIGLSLTELATWGASEFSQSIVPHIFLL